MSKLQIKCRKSDTTVEVQYEFPESVGDACEMYSEEVVLNRFTRQISQELRATVIRSVEALKHEDGTPPANVRKAINKAARDAAASFSPSITSGTSRAVKTIDKALQGLSEEERALVMKALSTTGRDTGNGGYPEASPDPLASA